MQQAPQEPRSHPALPVPRGPTGGGPPPGPPCTEGLDAGCGACVPLPTRPGAPRQLPPQPSAAAGQCGATGRCPRLLPPSAFVPLAASGRCPPAPRLRRQQRVFHLPGAWGLPGLGVARSPPRESPQAAASRPRPPGMPGGGVGAAACVTRPEFQPFCLHLPITAGGSDRPGAFEGTSAQPSAPGAGSG